MTRLVEARLQPPFVEAVNDGLSGFAYQIDFLVDDTDMCCGRRSLNGITNCRRRRMHMLFAHIPTFSDSDIVDRLDVSSLSFALLDFLIIKKIAATL